MLSRLPRALDGLSIVQLSDFHYDSPLNRRAAEEAVQVTNRLHPDLIVLTGDFVTVSLMRKTDPAAALACFPCAELLSDLKAPFGVLAIMGNHDHFSDPNLITTSLQKHGIGVLRNEAFMVRKNGAAVWIVGLDTVSAGCERLRVAMKSVPPEEAVVLLVHEPDYADIAAGFPIDLQLSGHSHGGQIRLPILGAPYLPQYAKKYPSGLRRIKNLILYTNAGLGTVRVPLRMNCPPEITFLTLHSPKQSVDAANSGT